MDEISEAALSYGNRRCIREWDKTVPEPRIQASKYPHPSDDFTVDSRRMYPAGYPFTLGQAEKVLKGLKLCGKMLLP